MKVEKRFDVTIEDENEFESGINYIVKGLVDDIVSVINDIDDEIEFRDRLGFTPEHWSRIVNDYDITLAELLELNAYINRSTEIHCKPVPINE